MKEKAVLLLKNATGLKKEEIENLIEIPPNPQMGDFAFPCFTLSKILKKSPIEISQSLIKKIPKGKEFSKIESAGPYINFTVDKVILAKSVLEKINKQKDKYGSSTQGKNKKIVLEFSSPNIAKPFGIGHLRSTIIGNSIANISDFLGYKTIRINYLGDWGTQFGYLIAGFKKFGSEAKLKKEPIKHLLEIYVKAVKEKLDDEAREEFKKLEQKNKASLALWRKFKTLSLKEFDKIYSELGIKFTSVSGESLYQEKMLTVFNELKKKKLLETSQGAEIVNLEKCNLGISLIKKSDGSTLYATRDIAAALDRYKKYKFSRMFYEVGSEQTLHFKQLFKILELLGYKWAKDCSHISHGLYLDKDGKKFATRKGKTIFMEDILNETKSLAKKEILKREKISEKDLDSRAEKIALAAIFYGDLKNYRQNNIVFDLDRFVSFEGNTGPYLLYSYARAKSILKKASKKQAIKLSSLSESEKNLISQLSNFPKVVEEAFNHLSPNLIANYAYALSQSFNEFYQLNKVLGSEEESFRLSLVSAFSQTLKNSLSLLGIETIERM